MKSGYKKILILIPTIIVLLVAVEFIIGQERKVNNYNEKEDFLESLTARLDVKGRELKLHGYYSESQGKWCIVVPSGYQNQKIYIEARTSKGNLETFSRVPSEGKMIFTWKDIYYPIDFINAENIETVYVTLKKNKTLKDIHEDKKEKIPGIVTVLDRDANVEFMQLKEFYGHGNDSWEADKKSYNLKFVSYENLLGMGENDDFVLLAGFRDNSLMSYVATTELAREVGFEYAPEFRLVNLYVEGEYLGVYFLAEKLEIDTNRIEISNVYNETKKVNARSLDSFDYQRWSDEEGLANPYYYNVENNPEDITGGYLLEIDVADYEDIDSRFVSKRRIKLTMKRARFSSREEVEYMWNFWTDFENALFDENGLNEKGIHYSQYIDMESFAMQWLFYELEQEGSMLSSIYYYKESDVLGDGLLHACSPWDMEHSYRMSEDIDKFELATSGVLKGYWSAFYKHEDFRQELCRVWKSKIVPAVEKMVAKESKQYEDGMKNLSWYQENITDVHRMENSRWRKMEPLEKCEEIKDILTLRLDVISGVMME